MIPKPAKRVPKFRSEAQEAEWWSTHDTSELFKAGKRVRPVKMPAEQIEFIKKRAKSRK